MQHIARDVARSRHDQFIDKINIMHVWSLEKSLTKRYLLE